MAESSGAGQLGDVWALLGVIAAACVPVAINFFKGFNAARPETEASRQVIIHQAELADLSDVQRQLAAINPTLANIGPKLEALFDVERGNKQLLEENRQRIEEALRSLRRMENEVDVARRMREERLLEASRMNESQKGPRS